MSFTIKLQPLGTEYGEKGLKDRHTKEKKWNLTSGHQWTLIYFHNMFNIIKI